MVTLIVSTLAEGYTSCPPRRSGMMISCPVLLSTVLDRRTPRAGPAQTKAPFPRREGGWGLGHAPLVRRRRPHLRVGLDEDQALADGVADQLGAAAHAQ